MFTRLPLVLACPLPDTTSWTFWAVRCVMCCLRLGGGIQGFVGAVFLQANQLVAELRNGGQLVQVRILLYAKLVTHASKDLRELSVLAAGQVESIFDGLTLLLQDLISEFYLS